MKSATALKEEKKTEESLTGGSSSSGYSQEYLAAGPGAQRVLQAGVALEKRLVKER